MNLFINVLDKHVPVRYHRVKRANQPDWVNSDILDAIKQRDKSKARNDIENYRLLRNKVTSLMNAARKSSIERKIEDGQNNPSTIWKIFKEFKPPNSRKSAINQLNIDGIEINDSETMSNSFNSFFTNVATSLKENTTYSDFPEINEYVNKKVPKEMFFNIPYITEEKVCKMLNDLDTSKATGLDNLGPRLLKMSANVIYPVIHHLINLSIKESTIPNCWKLAKVNPFFKSGSAQDVNNYRPISILPTLSKLIEKHVHDSFMAYLNHYNLLSKSQSGFRKNHSCETALVSMLDKWIKALNEGKFVGVIMIDFRKAFDLVDFDILIRKLKIYKCSDHTINFFKSYLYDRKQVVNLNGVLSEEAEIKCGVPQGSILGPLLFLLFINDLSQVLSTAVNSTDLYADDTTISDISFSKDILQQNLQHSLDILETWCKENGMVLNTEKTKVIFITTPQKRTKMGNIQLNVNYKNVSLKLTTGDKLLGVHIQDNLKWDTHINSIKRKIASNIWLLSKIKYFIPLNSRIIYYKAYIQPHLDFCNVIWGGTGVNNLNKLLSLQKRACKTIFGPEYVNFKDALNKINSLTIHQRIILQKAKFMYKVHNKLVPEYIQDMYQYRESSGLNIRNSSSTDFEVPRPRIELFKESMSYSGSRIWNSIPENIRLSKTINQFTINLTNWIKQN